MKPRIITIIACAGAWRTGFRIDGGHGSGGMADSIPRRWRTFSVFERNGVRHDAGMVSAIAGEGPAQPV